MLHVLCAGSMSELVQQLLEKGVDYTIPNKVTDFSDGITSFHSFPFFQLGQAALDLATDETIRKVLRSLAEVRALIYLHK